MQQQRGNYLQTLNKEMEAGFSDCPLLKFYICWTDQHLTRLKVTFFSSSACLTNQLRIPVKHADEKRLGLTVTAVHF